MVGRRSLQTPSINRLTSLPDSVLSNAGDRVTSNSNTSSDGTPQPELTINLSRNPTQHQKFLHTVSIRALI